MQRNDIVAFFAALYYGMGIHSLTELSILVSHSLHSTEGFFEPCRYLGNTAAASFLITGTYPQWKSLFLGEGYPQWNLSLMSLLGVGFAYGNAIVYPTELVCGLYTSSTQYILDRLLLAAPSAMLLACFAEVCGWNAHMRRWLMA
jgi:hypothetical protein